MHFIPRFTQNKDIFELFVLLVFYMVWNISPYSAVNQEVKNIFSSYILNILSQVITHHYDTYDT